MFERIRGWVNREKRQIWPWIVVSLLFSGYVAGTLKPHNHTSAAGDGGLLSTLSVSGQTKVSSGTFIMDGNNGGGTIQFGDGTQQSSAGSALSGANTFTGNNTFAGNMIYTGAAGAAVSLNQIWTINATSFDGATQSSGCVVAIFVNPTKGNNASSNNLVFSSTTSVAAGPLIGVLTGSCAPGAVCPVAVHGLMRIQATASQGVNSSMVTTGTRCSVQASALNVQGSGVIMASDGSTWLTGYLNGPI